MPLGKCIQLSGNFGSSYTDALKAFASDFCFEAWVKGGSYYSYNGPRHTGIVAVQRNPGVGVAVSFRVSMTAGVVGVISTDSGVTHELSAGNIGDFTDIGGGWIQGPSTWSHYALVRSGTSLKLYKDGVLKASTTVDAGLSLDGRSLNFGYEVGLGNNVTRSVLVDDLRYTVGQPVYTSNFSKPASALTDIAGATKFLLSFDAETFANSAASGIDVSQPGYSTISDYGWSPPILQGFVADSPYEAGGGGGGGNLRKPLFIGSDGKPVEMQATDSLQLGSLSLTGALAMGSNKITGIAQASASGDILAWGQNASIADLTVTGALGANLDAGGYKITNIADPTSAQDAASKAYVDQFKTSLDYKDSVRAIAVSGITLSGTQTIDGVSLAAGDRVLVAGNGAASGIYVVASGAWSRAIDADSSAKLGPDSFCFVEEGTSYADTGWVMAADATFTLGTSSQTWVQFSSKGVTLPGVALEKVANTINILFADGLAVNGSNQLVVDLATDPGLQFSTGKLDLKLASADRLVKDASGLDVSGLPSLFKLDGTSVSSNVTAANLGTLTAGIESDATALHAHKRVEAAYSGSQSVGAPVYISANDTVVAADSSDDSKRWVSGVVRASSGGTVKIVSKGVCPGVLSGATAGTKYYLASGGGLTATQPAAGENAIVVGVAINATDLDVRVIDQGKRAI